MRCDRYPDINLEPHEASSSHYTPDILLVARNNIHGHEHIERIIDASPDVLFVEGDCRVQFELLDQLVGHLRAEKGGKQNDAMISTARRRIDTAGAQTSPPFSGTWQEKERGLRSRKSCAQRGQFLFPGSGQSCGSRTCPCALTKNTRAPPQTPARPHRPTIYSADQADLQRKQTPAGHCAALLLLLMLLPLLYSCWCSCHCYSDDGNSESKTRRPRCKSSRPFPPPSGTP